MFPDELNFVSKRIQNKKKSITTENNGLKEYDNCLKSFKKYRYKEQISYNPTFKLIN